MFLEGGFSNPAPVTQKSVNNQKKLRSLNDVLGKNIPPSKASKNSQGNAISFTYLSFNISLKKK